MIYKVYHFIVKYEVVFDLIINILLVCIAYHGVETIKKHQIRKNTDHKYNQEMLMFEKKQNQLSQLIVALSEVKLSFMTFTNNYGNAKHGQNLKLDNMNRLIINMELLESDYIFFSKVIIQSYLIDLELEKECMKLRFLLNEYTYAYSKILNHLEKVGLIPSKFDKEDEIFKNETMPISRNTERLFENFENVEKLIIEASSNTSKKDTIFHNNV